MASTSFGAGNGFEKKVSIEDTKEKGLDDVKLRTTGNNCRLGRGDLEIRGPWGGARVEPKTRELESLHGER